MERFLLLSTLVVLAGGCGVLLDFDPPDPVDAGTTDMGVPTDSGLHGVDANLVDGSTVDAVVVDGAPLDAGPPPCRTAAECTDHVFCNGVERCVMGACVAGAPPMCPAGSASCVEGACDAATDACVLHPNDALCPSGEICDRAIGCHAPPTCGTDTDCAHDACHTAHCVGGTCLLGPIAPCVDPNPSDCLVEFCHPVLGCTSSPSVGLCDDARRCTTDVCNTDGSCGHLPDPTVCNDGRDCTVDACNPTNGCADPTTGCTATPDDTVCDTWVLTLGFTDPPSNCFTTRCQPGAGADALTGCLLTPRCTAPGTTCLPMSFGVDGGVLGTAACPLSGPSSCVTSTICDDGNACNGVETCAGGLCAAGVPPCPAMSVGSVCAVDLTGDPSCVTSLPACIATGP